MDQPDVEEAYRSYLATLNERRFADLLHSVHDRLVYNDRSITRDDYVAMLEADVAAIPDLYFEIDLLVVDGGTVACRLWFDCTPRTDYFGLSVAGRHLGFAEHVFYAMDAGRIRRVWSLIDTAAIAEQARRVAGP